MVWRREMVPDLDGGQAARLLASNPFSKIRSDGAAQV